MAYLGPVEPGRLKGAGARSYQNTGPPVTGRRQRRDRPYPAQRITRSRGGVAGEAEISATVARKLCKLANYSLKVWDRLSYGPVPLRGKRNPALQFERPAKFRDRSGALRPRPGLCRNPIQIPVGGPVFECCDFRADPCPQEIGSSIDARAMAAVRTHCNAGSKIGRRHMAPNSLSASSWAPSASTRSRRLVPGGERISSRANLRYRIRQGGPKMASDDDVVTSADPGRPIEQTAPVASAGPQVTAPHSQRHIRCRPQEQAMLPTSIRPGRSVWPRGHPIWPRLT
jgi:hypothetical protein